MLRSIVLLPKSIEQEKSHAFLSDHINSMLVSKGFISMDSNSGPIMSPGGPTDHGNVLTTLWESLEDFVL